MTKRYEMTGETDGGKVRGTTEERTMSAKVAVRLAEAQAAYNLYNKIAALSSEYQGDIKPGAQTTIVVGEAQRELARQFNLPWDYSNSDGFLNASIYAVLRMLEDDNVFVRDGFFCTPTATVFS